MAFAKKKLRVQVPIRVRVCAPRSQGAPWRSVVLKVGRADTFPPNVYPWVWLKALVKRIAKQAGADPKQATARSRCPFGYNGYIRVYRGSEPTADEKRLFRRVLDIAISLAPECVSLDDDLQEKLSAEGVKLPKLPDSVFE